jgi:pimeloyl-ACP methyl ester carboxylesterase
MATWVFLRGLVREQRHWGRFVDQFQGAMPGHRVVTLDLPGNGALHNQLSPSTVHGMVQSCRQQLQAMDIGGPFHLLAMSMGAMVAAQWTTDHPSEVSSQVLINTSMRPLSPVHHRLRVRNYAPILGLMLGRTSNEKWEQAILRMTSNAPHKDVLAQWVQWRAQYPVSRHNALRQLWAAARFRVGLERPTVPTLILASRRDRLVSVRCSERLAAQWQVPLRLHPSAGHDLPLDDGLWVIQQICHAADILRA